MAVQVHLFIKPAETQFDGEPSAFRLSPKLLLLLYSCILISLQGVLVSFFYWSLEVNEMFPSSVVKINSGKSFCKWIQAGIVSPKEAECHLNDQELQQKRSLWCRTEGWQKKRGRQDAKGKHLWFKSTWKFLRFVLENKRCHFSQSWWVRGFKWTLSKGHCVTFATSQTI